MIDFVRHYMYSKAERHTLKKKLEKIAGQLSFKPKLFFVFGGFFCSVQEQQNAISLNINFMCLKLEAMTIQIVCMVHHTKFFLSFNYQVLAICFERKALDFIFTQHELKWMDELLPGSKINQETGKVRSIFQDHVYMQLSFNLIGLIQLPCSSFNNTKLSF